MQGNLDGDDMGNDNRTLFTHMRTDPNAPKHAILGAAVTTIVLVVAYLTHTQHPLILAFLAPFALGVAIEIIQRIQGGTNTNRESMMDILTTGFWYLTIFAWGI